MIVFNTITIIELIVAAIPAAIAAGIAHLLGGDTGHAAVVTGAISVIVIDALVRLAAVGGSEDEDEAAHAGPAGDGEFAHHNEGDEDDEDGVSGPLALIWPSGGGHVMFLPNYVVGGFVLYATFAWGL